MLPDFSISPKGLPARSEVLPAGSKALPSGVKALLASLPLKLVLRPSQQALSKKLAPRSPNWL